LFNIYQQQAVFDTYNMSLNIYFGPMYAGKTTKLIGMYNQISGFDKIIIDYDIASKSTEKSQNHVLKGNLESHDKIIVPNVHRCKKLSSLYKKENYMLFSNDVLDYYYNLFHDSKFIFINECQFFDDLKTFVLEMLSHNKRIFLFGLDGDYRQKQIGQTFELITYATTVEKITGKCSECKECSIVSHRTSNETKVYLPDADAYVPLCLNCHREKIIEKHSSV
jgi:thymidine kinase